ncbi:MAG TPA: acetoin utilization protein AcuC [Anaerolineae bacterium]|nr:acetoin utilization protein AcuC [Anaerolineae bacterium]
MTKAAVVLAEELWQLGHGQSHPLKPERLQRAYELLNAYQAFDGQQSRLLPPRLATREDLLLFHTEEYVDAVHGLSRGEGGYTPSHYNFGPGDNPVFEGMYDIAAWKVGAALRAMELVTSGEVDVAFSPAGGMHHARANHASGFCIFNDLAVIIHHMLARGLRVVYVDIDVHHGDGVQEAFYDTDRVLTVSIHESGHFIFPGTGFVNETGSGVGQGFAVNVPLAPYTDDETYVWVFEQVVPPLLRWFQPDIVVRQLGIDTHFLDPLGHLTVTTQGYTQVVRAIKGLAPRWVALGGGGYEVDVMPRAWTLAYGMMSEQEFPNQLPPSYAEKYGQGTLHDHNKPKTDAATKGIARRHATRVIAELRERIPGLRQ